MSIRRTLGVLALALPPAGVVLAQAPALGPAFQANTYTGGTQAYAGAAMDTSGNLVVCWQSDGQDGDGFGVFGQFYPAAGAPPSEAQLDTETAGWQIFPSAATNEFGNFVVAWSTLVNPGPSSSYAIRFRRYDAAGTPLADPTTVLAASGVAFEPRVAVQSTGAFIVVWFGSGSDADGRGVSGQRFDADGNPLTAIFPVNTYTTGRQASPVVARDAADDFVVSWIDYGQDGSQDGIYAQRFDAAGNKVGGEFSVNTYTTGYQTNPSVGMDAAGNFVVVWDSAGQDGDGFGIFGQRFDASGNRTGREFQINTTTTGYQENPTVVMDPTSGAFLVVWTDWSRTMVVGQKFTAAGDPVGAEFPVLADSWRPSLALGAPWEAVVAAQGTGTDPSGGISARVLYLDAALPMSVDTQSVAGSSSNVNGVLEPGEIVQVAPFWRRQGALGYTGAASNFTGPAGPVYELTDAAATYEWGFPDVSVDCTTIGPDCYLLGVSGPRPAPHWDATFDETLATGTTKTWTLHVGASFADVPTSNPFYTQIENIFHNGITGGCGGGDYCPASSVTRAQMAVFLLKAKHGAAFVPPACAGVFGDVTCPSPFADWIEELAAEGITGGCGGGNFCPDNPVTRAQMAVFLLKAEHGSSFVPSSCNGLFADVACPSLFADWIEQLAAEQITGGCGGGNYCPGNPNTRGQMAVFLVKTFGLQLYGP